MTFFSFLSMIKETKDMGSEIPDIFVEVLVMKLCKSWRCLVGIIALAGIVAAAVTTVFIFLDKKKKDEEELEHYLDCSIQ